MTYKDLLDNLKTLSESSLEQTVVIVGENFSSSDCEIIVLEEDYVNETGDGMEPISCYLEDEEYKKDPWELNIVAKKGDVFITC